MPAAKSSAGNRSATNKKSVIRKETPTKKASKTSTRKKSTRSGRVASQKPAKQKCFVISPFGGWFDDYFVKVFAPAIESAGLEPHRADNIYRPSPIIQDIWEEINEADVLLAEITGRNPNVMYEMGLAHALRKPVVMVTQLIADVPFDIQTIRVISYDLADPTWAETLRERIASSIREALQSPSTTTLQPFVTREDSEGNDLDAELLAGIRSLERRVNLIEARQTSSPPLTWTPATGYRSIGSYGRAASIASQPLLFEPTYYSSGLPPGLTLTGLANGGVIGTSSRSERNEALNTGADEEDEEPEGTNTGL